MNYLNSILESMMPHFPAKFRNLLVNYAANLSTMLKIDEILSLELCITAGSYIESYPHSNEGLIALSLYFHSLKQLISHLKETLFAFDGNSFVFEQKDKSDNSRYSDMITSKLISMNLISVLLDVIEKYELSQMIKTLDEYESVDRIFIFSEVLNNIESILVEAAESILILCCQKSLNVENIEKIFKFVQQSKFDETKPSLFKCEIIILLGLLFQLDISDLLSLNNFENFLSKDSFSFLLENLKGDAYDKWHNREAKSLLQLGLSLSLKLINQQKHSLPDFIHEEENEVIEELFDMACLNRCFSILNKTFSLFPIISNEIIQHRMSKFSMSLIHNFYGKINDLKLIFEESLGQNMESLDETDADEYKNLSQIYYSLICFLTCFYDTVKNGDSLNAFWNILTDLDNSDTMLPTNCLNLIKSHHYSLHPKFIIRFGDLLKSLIKTKSQSEICFRIYFYQPNSHILSVNSQSSLLLSIDHINRALENYIQDIRNNITDNNMSDKTPMKILSSNQMQTKTISASETNIILTYFDLLTHLIKSSGEILNFIHSNFDNYIDIYLEVLSCPISLEIKIKIVSFLSSVAQSVDTIDTIVDKLTKFNIINYSDYNSSNLLAEIVDFNSNSSSLQLSCCLLQLFEIFFTNFQNVSSDTSNKIDKIAAFVHNFASKSIFKSLNEELTTNNCKLFFQYLKIIDSLISINIVSSKKEIQFEFPKLFFSNEQIESLTRILGLLINNHIENIYSYQVLVKSDKNLIVGPDVAHSCLEILKKLLEKDQKGSLVSFRKCIVNTLISLNFSQNFVMMLLLYLPFGLTYHKHANQVLAMLTLLADSESFIKLFDDYLVENVPQSSNILYGITSIVKEFKKAENLGLIDALFHFICKMAKSKSINMMKILFIDNFMQSLEPSIRMSNLLDVIIDQLDSNLSHCSIHDSMSSVKLVEVTNSFLSIIPQALSDQLIRKIHFSSNIFNRLIFVLNDLQTDDLSNPVLLKFIVNSLALISLFLKYMNQSKSHTQSVISIKNIICGATNSSVDFDIADQNLNFHFKSNQDSSSGSGFLKLFLQNLDHILKSLPSQPPLSQLQGDLSVNMSQINYSSKYPQNDINSLSQYKIDMHNLLRNLMCLFDCIFDGEIFSHNLSYVSFMFFNDILRMIFTEMNNWSNQSYQKSILCQIMSIILSKLPGIYTKINASSINELLPMIKETLIPSLKSQIAILEFNCLKILLNFLNFMNLVEFHDHNDATVVFDTLHACLDGLVPLSKNNNDPNFIISINCIKIIIEILSRMSMLEDASTVVYIIANNLFENLIAIKQSLKENWEQLNVILIDVLQIFTLLLCHENIEMLNIVGRNEFQDVYLLVLSVFLETPQIFLALKSFCESLSCFDFFLCNENFVIEVCKQLINHCNTIVKNTGQNMDIVKFARLIEISSKNLSMIFKSSANLRFSIEGNVEIMKRFIGKYFSLLSLFLNFQAMADDTSLFAPYNISSLNAILDALVDIIQTCHQEDVQICLMSLSDTKNNHNASQGSNQDRNDIMTNYDDHSPKLIYFYSIANIFNKLTDKHSMKYTNSAEDHSNCIFS
ncbi:MAG: hypothetical protein MHMPM18_000500 [Marteilia pararefringens]